MEQTLQNVVYKIQNMACYQLAAPAQFDFPQPASWPSWLQGFERFRLASKLNDDSEENQVNSLIYAMGKLAEEIFKSLGLSSADAKTYDTVKTTFMNHFIVQHNVIFERAKFNRRVQGPQNQSISLSLYSTHSLNIASLAPCKMR